MTNSLFSILIANYNNGHFFKDCYASIMAQTYENWEVILFDDASTDDSLSQIKQLIGDDSRFKIFQNKHNKGCGYTKRKCAELATGEICGFLDPDDTLDPEALTLMIEAHLQRKECSIITSKYFQVGLDLKKIGVAQHGESIPKNKSYLTYGKGALTHFATFKKELYEQTTGIDVKFKRAVDQDLYYKMEEVGAHFFLDKPIYNYRIHSNSISANTNAYKAEYWHIRAMLDAYLRRKKNKLQIDNFKDREFKIFYSDYYYKRYSKARLDRNKKVQLYFVLMALKEYPLRKTKKRLKEIIKIIVK